VILSELAKYSMMWSMARPLCDIRATCFVCHTLELQILW